MMRIMVKRAISIFLIAQGAIILTYIYSYSFFINLEVAFLSSFFVIVGSSIAYSKMVKKQVNLKEYEEDRDPLDKIEDPYELYDNEINNAPVDELNIKEIIKEEKSKIKTFNTTSLKYGSKGGFSPFRIVPYIFLILGFIALKNNNLLDIMIYLPSLMVGIVVGSISSKRVFS